MTSCQAPDSAYLSIRGLRHHFGAVEALGPIDIEVPADQFVAVIGRSGCGKSTLLRILAGLLAATEGSAQLGGVELISKPGNVAYLPQEDSLLPWKRALDNATAGVELSRVERTERRARAAELFQRFGLGGFENAWPHELSGGMRQRVAVLRSVLLPQRLLALDEPFGALDALTRRSMQHWTEKLWIAYPRTTILVTHDVDEALRLSDRVLVMSERPGRILEDIGVDLPRPRDRDVEECEQRQALRAAILDALEGRR